MVLTYMSRSSPLSTVQLWPWLKYPEAVSLGWSTMTKSQNQLEYHCVASLWCVITWTVVQTQSSSDCATMSPALSCLGVPAFGWYIMKSLHGGGVSVPYQRLWRDTTAFYKW